MAIDNNAERKVLLEEISKNLKVYHFLIDCAQYYLKKGNINKSIIFCQKAASYAVANYCGFYAEYRLEYLLLKVKELLFCNNSIILDYSKSINGKMRILHYATELYGVGGHTKLLENWIKNDSANIHDVFVSVSNSFIPKTLSKVVQMSSGAIIQSNSEDIISKVNSLNALRGKYDIIVLHHHPDDVVPLLSFSDEGIAPVAVLNHGDHRYWLGCIVCDILIEFRENMIPADRYNRTLSDFAVLPIPIAKQEYSDDSYSKSRQRLNIGQGEVVLLSIGTRYKYSPFSGKNFFVDIIEVLEINPKARMLLIGINEDDELAVMYSHPRLTFISSTPFLDDFRSACDVYVEGFPFSSFTAYMEVGALGKPVHRMYEAPLLNKYEMKDYAFPVQWYDTKSAWIEGLNKLIRNVNKRKVEGKNMQTNMCIHTDVDVWKAYLTVFYSAINKIKHFVNLDKQDIPLILDDNALYLHKMQRGFNINLSLDEVYDLSLSMKAKMMVFGIHKIVLKRNLAFKDSAWFLFKSKYINFFSKHFV